MTNSDDDNGFAAIDEGFRLLSDPTGGSFQHRELKRQDEEWKLNDPEGYRKDMETMCKEMFGDSWEVEYEAMLREEFPEEFDSDKRS